MHLLITRVLRDRLMRYGITTAQWYFLRALWIENGLTQRQLSERVQTTNATTTNALRLMERDGYVTRQRDSHDRRTVRVFYTRKSRTLHDEILPFIGELNNIALQGLSHEQVSRARGLFTHIRGNLRAELELSQRRQRSRGDSGKYRSFDMSAESEI